MTAQELIAAFEIFAEAPEGISQLRGFLLELAVRGKLVHQKPLQEDASSLLAKVSGERKELLRNKQIRKRKKVTAPDPPFDIPSSWAWAVLGELLIDGPTNGWSPKSVDFETNVKSLKLSATTSGEFNGKEFKWVDAELPEDSPLWLASGDLLIQRSNTPDYVGMAAIFDGAAQTFIYPDLMMRCRVSNHISTRFVHWALLAPTGRGWFREQANGTSKSMVKINQGHVRTTPIPIPPREEQDRIVACLDQLMTLIDRLEAAKNARDETRVALRDSALAALREADTPEEVEAAWNRVAVNLSDLVREPGDVEPLREVVLELAVRGKLVPQKPTEASATTLLGKRAQSHDSSDIPAGWAVSNLNSLGDVLSGGTPRKSNPNYWGGSIPWVSPKDMKRDFIGESIDSITEAAIEETSSKLIAPGALLMVVRGMILAHSFPTALTTQKVAINQDMKALIPFDQRIAPYLLLATKGMKRTILEKVERSTHGTCKLPTDSLLNVPILIPPLAEQHRILERVDELTDLLDELQQRLLNKREAHASFAEAAVHHFEMEPSKPRKAEQLTLGLEA